MQKNTDGKSIVVDLRVTINEDRIPATNREIMALIDNIIGNNQLGGWYSITEIVGTGIEFIRARKRLYIAVEDGRIHYAALRLPFFLPPIIYRRENGQWFDSLKRVAETMENVRKYKTLNGDTIAIHQPPIEEESESRAASNRFIRDMLNGETGWCTNTAFCLIDGEYWIAQETVVAQTEDIATHVNIKRTWNGIEIIEDRSLRPVSMAVLTSVPPEFLETYPLVRVLNGEMLKVAPAKEGSDSGRAE